ncbi:hypothetical protein [Mycobacterium sp. 1274761.0]|uniref:hypothetical protein n=1 Tax=Mycobacterium sp. 1274761.0 TaxID=1834077 RepID=UPI0012E7216C|nr:hypothetical protein [Mycobacterium sp. 1274761.0]
MNAKDMVLQDLPHLYPGLTRAGVERILRILENPPGGHVGGLASHIVALAPDIAKRLTALSGQQLDDYLHALKGAAVTVLRLWTSADEAPPPAAIVTGVADWAE